MPTAPTMTDLAKQIGKNFRLKRIRAVLGDQNGNMYEATAPGYVWVTKQDDNGVQFTILVRSGSVAFPMIPGMAVLLGYDRTGALQIAEQDFEGMLAGLINPLLGNPLNRDVYQYITQDRIQTSVSYAVGTAAEPSTQVVVRPWFVRWRDGTWMTIREKLVELSSFFPSAGEHCLVAIWRLSDGTTTTSASTAQSLGTALDDTDVNECQSGVDLDAEPIAFWRVYGGQTNVLETDFWRDGRQFINVTDALLVREADSAPPVLGVTEIVLPNGTLTDNGGGQVTLAAGLGAPLPPKRASCWHDEALVLTGNALVRTVSATAAYNNTSAQTTAADGDSFTFSIFLQAGTYTLSVLGNKTPDGGKLDWSLDGANFLTSQDWYDGTGVNNVIQTGTVTVSTSGTHVLKGTVNGHNGSSSGYTINLVKYWLAQSAD